MALYIGQNPLWGHTRDTKQWEPDALKGICKALLSEMRGYPIFLNIFDHTEVNSLADSPECFPFLHVRNAMPAPGWFQPQEKCLNRQQLAGFPLFPQGYQKNSEKKIKMKFPTGFAWLITSFEGGIDKTESKTQRS